jgi:hypothetical protein
MPSTRLLVAPTPPGLRAPSRATDADAAHSDLEQADHGSAHLQLWNPTIAAGLSLIFTPVFGALLHCMNAEALGDARLCRIAWMWLLLALAFTASGLYLVSLGDITPVSSFAASALLGGYTVIWYSFAANKQTRLVNRLGRLLWRPRSFTLPVLMALTVMCAPAGLSWLHELV